MKVKLTKKDVIWNYIGTIMSMGSNLFLLPFILHFLDGDMYGLWGVYASIGAIATLFDCGFSVTFARNITYCWSGSSNLKKEGVVYTENQDIDYYLIKKVLATCKYIYLILSLLAYVLMLTFGTWYIWWISKNIEGFSHIVAWIIYATAAFLNLYFGYYASFLRGVGAISKVNINAIVSRGAQIILTIILLFSGLGLIGACVGYLAYGTIFRFLGKSEFYKYNNIGFNLKKVEKEPSLTEKKELLSVVWHNAWKDGIISVCNYLSNQATTIICSLYLSLAETGMYSLGVQIASAIAQIAGALYNGYQPELQNSYVCNNKKRTKEIMSLTIVSYIYLYIIGTIGILFVGVPLLKIIKSDSSINSYVIFGLCIYQFILKFRNCYTSYYSATNRIVYVNAFVCSAVLCVLLSFISCGYLKDGLRGLIFAQIISQLVYNAWHWPLMVHRELKLSFIELMIQGNLEVKKMFSSFMRNKI